MAMLHVQKLVANVPELVLAIKMDEVTTDSVEFKIVNSFVYSQYKHEVDYDNQFGNVVLLMYSTFCRLQQNNSLRGSKNSLLGTNNSLWGTNDEYCRVINILRLHVIDVNFSHNFLEIILLLSGDIELNPGPVMSDINNVVLPSQNNSDTLRSRLSVYGLRPVDVGAGGDCFFKSVSHQLYGDPNRHLEIRAAGVQHLIDNPECSIESNTEGSWLGYLTNRFLQGTWADHIIIQAVANAMGLNIHIVESDNRFFATNVVESISGRNPRTVFLGHISETHYVSTCPVLLENASETSLNTKTTRSEYMKNYRAKRTSGNDKAKRNEYNKKSRASKNSAENRAKRNAYNKKSRAKKRLTRG